MAPSPSASPTTDAALAWGPTRAQWEAALADANALTDAEAAGQVIVASYASPDPAGLTDLITDSGLGGVILLGDAITDRAGVAALTAAASATGNDRGVPTIVSVDQEGGDVARLASLVEDVPGFMAAGAVRDKAEVHTAYASLGVELRELGFTVNYAPVADMTVGAQDPTIRSRSAGDEPGNVSATVTAAVAGLRDSGVVAAIKHFPGHGSVPADSHVQLPVQTATVAELEQRDFRPFAAAIEGGAPMVMMAHIQVPEWGPGPATLEPAAYAYVREVMGFSGVIATDALNMDPVTDDYSSRESAPAAIAAGADLLLVPPHPAAAVDGIVAALKSGELPRARLVEAAARVILMARWQASAKASSEAVEGYARDYAASAATVATADCDSPLVGDEVRLVGGSTTQRKVLAAALKAKGVGIADTGTSVLLARNSFEGASADVVVALSIPWILGQAEAGAYVGLYGGSDDALRGLADVLVDGPRRSSDWPVAMPELPFEAC
jgi:beta-N-acetylhexosaminidase